MIARQNTQVNAVIDQLLHLGIDSKHTATARCTTNELTVVNSALTTVHTSTLSVTPAHCQSNHCNFIPKFIFVCS